MVYADVEVRALVARGGQFDEVATAFFFFQLGDICVGHIEFKIPADGLVTVQAAALLFKEVIDVAVAGIGGSDSLEGGEFSHGGGFKVMLNVLGTGRLCNDGRSIGVRFTVVLPPQPLPMHIRLFLLCLFLTTALAAQNSHEITVTIDGYDQDILTLGYYLLDNQYIVDTASRTDAGTFVFTSDTAALEQGIYLVVLAPDNQYFQLLVGKDEDQVFAMKTRVGALNEMEISGSEENERFYDYLAFLDRMQQESAPVRVQLADSTLTPAATAAAQQAMEGIDHRVKTHQQQLISAHPDAFVSAIIQANQATIPPDFQEVADPEDRRTRQWRWLQEHYFDGLDLADARLLRTPFLFERIDYYVKKLQVNHPDTLAAAIDRVLARFDPLSDAFKYYTVHYINEAASSKIVGMDALYVHMIDRYYKTGRAYWTDEEQLSKMIQTAEDLQPLLIGKTAPDIAMFTREGEPLRLYDVAAEYTVLYFWRYDCPACKKSTPPMKEFYAKWKDKDVKIFSVCTKGEDDLGQCWEYVDEHETGDWVQVVDPYQRYYKAYDIKSTPTIFLLDKDKKIISKRIGADQLDEVLTLFTEQNAAEAGK